jgi:AraC-like DNA-binding protein
MKPEAPAPSDSLSPGDPAAAARGQLDLTRYLIGDVDTYVDRAPDLPYRIVRESIAPGFDRYNYFGEASGRQDRIMLSSGACAFINDLDHIDRYRLEQTGDDLVLFQFKLQGKMTVSAGDLHGSFERPACQIAYFPTGQSREISHPGGPSRAASVICRREALETWGLFDALPEGLREQITGAGAYLAAIPLTASQIESVESILRCGYRPELRRAYVEGKSLELISAVLDSLDRLTAAETANSSFSPGELRRAREAHEVLEADLSLPHTLASVARAVGLSRVRLSAAFKAVYGVTFFNRLRDLRMMEAHRLLNVDGTPIVLVAQRVGYEDASSFTRAFKAHFGVLPRFSRG